MYNDEPMFVWFQTRLLNKKNDKFYFKAVNLLEKYRFRIYVNHSQILHPISTKSKKIKMKSLYFILLNVNCCLVMN